LFVLQGHIKSGVVLAKFSPDARRIVEAGAADHTVRVWDAATRRPLLDFDGGGHDILRMDVSADGRKAVTGCDDGTARVWELANGRKLFQITLGGGVLGEASDPKIYGVAFSPDGQRLVITRGQTATVCNAETGQRQRTLTGLRNFVWSVAFSPDSRRILTGSGDGAARLWDTVTGRPLLTLNMNQGWVWSMAFSPNGRRLATQSGGVLRIWEAASPEQVAAWQEEEEQKETNP
jgi:WD40 repeat protein